MSGRGDILIPTLEMSMDGDGIGSEVKKPMFLMLGNAVGVGERGMENVLEEVVGVGENSRRNPVSSMLEDMVGVRENNMENAASSMLEDMVVIRENVTENAVGVGKHHRESSNRKIGWFLTVEQGQDSGAWEHNYIFKI